MSDKDEKSLKEWYRLNNTEKLKSKIRAGQIIGRIQAFVFNEPIATNQFVEPAIPEFSAQQMKGALALLDRIMPPRSSVELTVDENAKTAVIGAQPLDEEAWSDKWPNQQSLSGPRNTDPKPH